MTALAAISPSALAANWGGYGPRLEVLARVSEGRLQVGDIVRAIDSGEMQLWQEPDGSVMLTEVLRHPGLREVHIISATGHDAKRWNRLWPFFEAWAKKEGAQKVTMQCREGWARVLAPLGFKRAAIVLEKML